MHVDVAGYSRLIGLDDLGTLERLRTLRSTLIGSAIDEHGGRIVNTVTRYRQPIRRCAKCTGSIVTCTLHVRTPKLAS